MLKLLEDDVFMGFDMYFQSCLQRAQRENLLDADISPFDLAISGRALALLYAALTPFNPPSIPILPVSSLNTLTCPPSLAQFTRHWAQIVPILTSLSLRDQLELKQILCGHASATNGSFFTRREITSLATELRFLAMQFDQRREFHKVASGLVTLSMAREQTRTIVFPSRCISSCAVSIVSAKFPHLPDQPQLRQYSTSPMATSCNGSILKPQIGAQLRPLPTIPMAQPIRKPSPFTRESLPILPATFSRTIPLPIRSHTLPTAIVPFAVLTLRETLYSAIAEVLSIYPSLSELFKRDGARACVTTLSLALLLISLSSVSSDGMTIRSVWGADISIRDMPIDYPCPDEGGDYRFFFEELLGIGRQAIKIVEEDNERAIAYAARGAGIPDSQLDRVKIILEQGVGPSHERQSAREEKEKCPEDAGRDNGTAMLFAARVNDLAMRVAKMKSLFKDCEDVI